MRTNDVILISKGMDKYHNNKLMGKGSPNEYSCVDVIEEFSEICIGKLINPKNLIGIPRFIVSNL